MVESLLLIFVVMIGLGTRGYLGTSPQMLKEAGFLTGSQPACREYRPSEFQSLGNDPKGKAATYSMDGEFVCERQIFEYGERDSFFDFIAQVAPGKLNGAARRLAQLQHTSADLSGDFVVRVLADESAIRIYLEDLARTEFAGYLKRGSISNLPATAESPSVIEIEVSRIQDRDLLLTTTALVDQDGVVRRWRL